MDIADRAQELTDLHLSKSLNSRNTLSIPFSGSCIFCKEPVVERRFCDSECREAHEDTIRRRHSK